MFGCRLCETRHRALHISRAGRHRETAGRMAAPTVSEPVHNGPDAVRVSPYPRCKPEGWACDRQCRPDRKPQNDRRPANSRGGAKRNECGTADRGRRRRSRTPHTGLARGRGPVAAGRHRLSADDSHPGHTDSVPRPAADRDRPSMVRTIVGEREGACWNG